MKKSKSTHNLFYLSNVFVRISFMILSLISAGKQECYDSNEAIALSSDTKTPFSFTTYASVKAISFSSKNFIDYI
jgi:hypothetical protein